MRSTHLLLALGAAATAFVVPNQQIFAQLASESESTQPTSGQPEWKKYGAWLEEMKQGLDDSMERLERGWHDAAADLSEMAEGAATSVEDCMQAMESVVVVKGGGDHHPHDDKTLYQVLAESEHFTEFVKLLDENEAFKDLLDKDDANVTLFAPSNHAFEHIPDHAKDPPKEWVEALLKFHVVPGKYAAKDIFHQHTLPTLLEGKHLSAKPEEAPQRLSVKLGWRGLYINGYNRVTHRDTFASNGIVHAVSTFNIPPPPLGAIISFVPTAFSQFELGLHKSGLGHIGHAPHLGATVFAPANSAWKGLGLRANAFLFSHWGHKYLRALLKYHIVANQTLYSDEYYNDAEDDTKTFPKGRAHLDLPTLLKGKSVGVDVGRYGRFIEIHVNHYSKVVFQDAIGHDGVIHVVNKILIPPHHGKGHDDAKVEEYAGGEMEVEELKARLEPYLECGDDVEQDNSEL